MFLHQWLLTLFAKCLPTQSVLVIWDTVVADGLPVLVVVPSGPSEAGTQRRGTGMSSPQRQRDQRGRASSQPPPRGFID